MCWTVHFKRASRPFDCCKLDLMGHRWPRVMALWKFWFQTDFYVHIRIALIYNTFSVIARASRPNKQRAPKPSMNLAFSWHTSKLSSLILWNARVTVSQSWFCLERVHPVFDADFLRTINGVGLGKEACFRGALRLDCAFVHLSWMAHEMQFWRASRVTRRALPSGLK